VGLHLESNRTIALKMRLKLVAHQIDQRRVFGTKELRKGPAIDLTMKEGVQGVEMRQQR